MINDTDKGLTNERFGWLPSSTVVSQRPLRAAGHRGRPARRGSALDRGCPAPAGPPRTAGPSVVELVDWADFELVWARRQPLELAQQPVCVPEREPGLLLHGQRRGAQPQPFVVGPGRVVGPLQGRPSARLLLAVGPAPVGLPDLDQGGGEVDAGRSELLAAVAAIVFAGPDEIGQQRADDAEGCPSQREESFIHGGQYGRAGGSLRPSRLFGGSNVSPCASIKCGRRQVGQPRIGQPRTGGSRRQVHCDLETASGFGLGDDGADARHSDPGRRPSPHRRATTPRTGRRFRLARGTRCRSLVPRPWSRAGWCAAR
jgi:hypothetical protein